MFRKANVFASNVLALTGIMLLALPRVGWSQPANDDVIDEVIDELDEIIVYGEPMLRMLRDEVWEAEENFYRLFNELNNGRQFDVTCYRRKKLGSQVSRRICEAYFVKSPADGVPTHVYYRHKMRQMQREMVALMDTHPELHAALSDYYDAKRSFDASFRERCGNRLSICRR